MRNASNKSCREIRTDILNSAIFFFFLENRAVLRDNVEKYDASRLDADQHGSCAWHTGYVSLHARKHTPAHASPHSHARTHTHTEMCNTSFHTESGFVNAPLCYVALRCLLLVYKLHILQYGAFGISRFPFVMPASVLCQYHHLVTTSQLPAVQSIGIS
jgi:hypothetical protein